MKAESKAYAKTIPTNDRNGVILDYTYAAFCLLCDLIKPITEENSSYPVKRFETALKTAGVDESSATLKLTSAAYQEMGRKLKTTWMFALCMIACLRRSQTRHHLYKHSGLG